MKLCCISVLSVTHMKLCSVFVLSIANMKPCDKFDIINILFDSCLRSDGLLQIYFLTALGAGLYSLALALY
jgi:hypothetical protein